MHLNEMRARADSTAMSCGTGLFSTMPRKPNYGFEKRRKEQERQKKTEAKREEKLRRKEEERAAGRDESPPAPNDAERSG